MKNKSIETTKVALLLNTFAQWEWYRFIAFSHSAYHNVDKDVKKLADWFSEHKSELNDFSKQAVFKAIRPNEAYQERLINYWLSDLNKLAERFLGVEKMNANSTQLDLLSLQALSERKLDKHVSFLEKKLDKNLGKNAIRDVDSFLFPNFQLSNLRSENAYRKAVRTTNEHVQNAVDALDRFYFAEKLRLSCSMLTHQQVLSSKYRFDFFEEIKNYITKQPQLLEEPQIGVYYSILLLLSNPGNDEVYATFLQKIMDFDDFFSRKELTQLYEYGLNFCAAEIRKQRTGYVEAAFFLYKNGLALGLFKPEGLLSPWHFKNIVSLGLRTEATEWTEAFIKQNVQYLKEDFQEDAYHYNLAEVYFQNGQYDLVIEHVQRVEFTDIFYSLDAKVVLSKVYKEQEQLDSLESLLHAFIVYLRRSKSLPTNTNLYFLNFAKMLQKIIKQPRKNYANLKEQIEKTQVIGSKNWLLSQLD